MGALIHASANERSGHRSAAEFDEHDLGRHAETDRHAGAAEAAGDDEIAVLLDDVAVDVAATEARGQNRLRGRR